jgi:phosphoserine phosphatase RsbU/P
VWQHSGIEPANLQDRRAEAQLELKDRALAATSEGITIADARLPDQPIIYANEGFERLTGYGVRDVLGRNCRFLQGARTDPDAVSVLRNALREQRAVTVQLLNYRKDGTPFWNRLSITPVRDETGEVTHYIGVQSDVTAEKKARDELERANRRLEEESLRTRRELEAAQEVQSSLLPVSLIHVPGFNFSYRFRPCGDVGGDCLNILPLAEGKLGIYILDVSGHGVAAALLSVTLSHMMSVTPESSFLFQPASDRPGSYTITPPSEVISGLNRHFVNRSAVTQFFTMIYGVLDVPAAGFRYVSAGHLSPIQYPLGGEPYIPEAGGIPVALLPSATYEEHEVRLSPGDRLYLCTDGIIEAENTSGEQFGLERLLDTLKEVRQLPLDDSVARVMARVDDWSGSAGLADDASLLAVERPA